MDVITKWVTYEHVTGEPVATGTVILRPRSDVLTIRWPNGVWIWNRPTAITVEEEGLSRRLPVVDVTRQGQWLLLGLAILFVTMSMMRR